MWRNREVANLNENSEVENYSKHFYPTPTKVANEKTVKRSVGFESNVKKLDKIFVEENFKEKNLQAHFKKHFSVQADNLNPKSSIKVLFVDLKINLNIPPNRILVDNISVDLHI